MQTQHFCIFNQLYYSFPEHLRKIRITKRVIFNEENAFIMHRSTNRSNLSHIGVAELDYSIRDKIGIQQKMVDLDKKN